LAAPALPLDLQTHADQVTGMIKTVTAACSGGVVYDDGSFETAYAIGTPPASMVMKIDPPAGTVGLDQVCIGFTRNSIYAPSSVAFNVLVYDDNGPSGSPGTLVSSVAATANAIPVFPSFAWYGVDLTSVSLTLPPGSFYVGARWLAYQPGSYFVELFGDRTVSTTQRSIYGSTNDGVSWTSGSSLFPTNAPRALAVRVDPRISTTACTPSPTTMCLAANRFAVSATWQTDSASGNAQVVKLTDDTGYFWFFAASNVEVVLKVLNACVPPFNRFWVFAGGLTNQRVVITVRDTSNGFTKTYVNNLGQAFLPVQDTSSFATCP
jgi:hypothetical protein